MRLLGFLCALILSATTVFSVTEKFYKDLPKSDNMTQAFFIGGYVVGNHTKNEKDCKKHLKSYCNGVKGLDPTFKSGGYGLKEVCKNYKGACHGLFSLLKIECDSLILENGENIDYTTCLQKVSDCNQLETACGSDGVTVSCSKTRMKCFLQGQKDFALEVLSREFEENDDSDDSRLEGACHKFGGKGLDFTRLCLNRTELLKQLKNKTGLVGVGYTGYSHADHLFKEGQRLGGHFPLLENWDPYLLLAYLITAFGKGGTDKEKCESLGGLCAHFNGLSVTLKRFCGKDGRGNNVKKMCEEFDYKIYDPLNGHLTSLYQELEDRGLVNGNKTIPWVNLTKTRVTHRDCPRLEAKCKALTYFNATGLEIPCENLFGRCYQDYLNRTAIKELEHYMRGSLGREKLKYKKRGSACTTKLREVCYLHHNGSEPVLEKCLYLGRTCMEMGRDVEYECDKLLEETFVRKPSKDHCDNLRNRYEKYGGDCDSWHREGYNSFRARCEKV
ncbi:uncharacterized protein T551_03109 [Pneumocystis jirovecii RU7]|uniref:Uncharacterized protein n=1 Tax=Pneumocystis jirovecii (strain RU7) TaxID=1408657 RepID=A0A0W4ZFH4_PNEJ7|nr:uncharacterized protein T551_03109 [Pneumocystis jirovecii RU7]KTW27115.1 hypothetical protein T551_03109 [Pneumocystis jirovecii RU7]